MAKTEVILIQNVVGLGAESDHVKVAAGYARNFLIPGGMAVPVTRANKRRLEVLRQRRADREAHDLNAMTELAKSLGKVLVTITVKTGDDGKMFGSVTSGTIVDALKTQLDVALDKKKIHLEKPIHTLGEHEVELRLHSEVRANLRVQVNSSTPLPQSAAAEAAEKQEKEARKTEKRGKRPAPEPPVPVPDAKAKAEKKPARTEKPGKPKESHRK
jgi:large subunit ribosomal protein L9